jgi:hypothetical protein
LFFFPFCIIEIVLIFYTMQYSTLQEAYNIDTFDKAKPQNKKAVAKANGTNGGNGGKPTENTQINTQQGPANIETSKLSSSSEKIDLGNYEKVKISNGGSCSPIQAPMYSIPVSGDCKKEKDEAMKVYIEENFKAGNTIEMTNRSHDNVMPYYDEDMEQYFDINNLTDEVKYNASSNPQLYMPNSNKKSYVNDNTGEYSNNTSVFTNGNNLLNTSEYNLSEEERKNASEALAYLKSLEGKINTNDGSNRNAISDQIIESNITGPGGYKNIPKENFEKNQEIARKEKEEREIREKRDKEDREREEKLQESIRENKKFENTINTIINVFIFIFIGGAIILLCDYLVEMAIQIGMKKTTNILEPYINNNYNNYNLHNMNIPHNTQHTAPYNAQHNVQHYSQYPSHYRHFQPVPAYQNAGTVGNASNASTVSMSENVQAVN